MRTNDRRYLCPIRDVYEVLRKVLGPILVCTKFARTEVPENTDFGPDILEHMPGAYVLEFEQCTSES